MKPHALVKNFLFGLDSSVVTVLGLPPKDPDDDDDEDVKTTRMKEKKNRQSSESRMNSSRARLLHWLWFLQWGRPG